MLAAMWRRALNLAAMGLAVAADRTGPGSVLAIAALTVANAVLRGFFDPVAAALVADLAPPELRVAAYSLQRVGINIGWAAGPAVAGPGGRRPLRDAVLRQRAADPAVGGGGGRHRRAARAPARGAPSPWPSCWPSPGTAPCCASWLATFAFFILQVQLYQTTSIYAASVLHLDRAEVGTLYTLNGVLVVLLQLPAIHYIQRLGTRRALIAGTLGYAVSYAAVGLATGQLSLLACIAAVTLAEIVTSPAQQAAVTALAPPGRTGAYTGLFGLCQVAGQSTGPLVGTTLLASLPPRAAWFALALFGVAGRPGVSEASAATQNHTSLWRPKPRRDVSCSAPAPWEAPESQVPRFPASFGTALQCKIAGSEPKPRWKGFGDRVGVCDFVEVSTRTPVNHHRERLSERE